MKADSGSAWVTACAPQLLARLLTIRGVEIQEGGSCACTGGQWDDSPSLGTEVVGPLVTPRVEQRQYPLRLRIHGSNVRTLESITLDTCQSKVAEVRLSAMLNGDDVVGLVRKKCA